MSEQKRDLTVERLRKYAGPGYLESMAEMPGTKPWIGQLHADLNALLERLGPIPPVSPQNDAKQP